MIRRHVLLALGLAFTTFATAQVALELPSQYLNNNTAGGANDLPPNVEGSPYLTDDFQKGTIYMEGEKPYTALMRYNAYQDEIQVQGTGGISSLFKRPYVKAVLGGETFQIESFEGDAGVRQGYFVEQNTGKVRLLKRYIRVFLPAEAATSSYSQGKPPRFEEENTWYLAREGSPAREVSLRKKDFLDFLDTPAVEDFVKKNKIRFKSEEEAVQVLQFYNAL